MREVSGSRRWARHQVSTPRMVRQSIKVAFANKGLEGVQNGGMVFVNDLPVHFFEFVGVEFVEQTALWEVEFDAVLLE